MKQMNRSIISLILVFSILFSSCGFATAATEYTATFETFGGLPVPPNQVVSPGDKFIKPPVDPVLTGYNFIGWRNATQLFPFEDPASSDMDFFAHYADPSLPPISLQYHYDGIHLTAGDLSLPDFGVPIAFYLGTNYIPRTPTKAFLNNDGIVGTYDISYRDSQYYGELPPFGVNLIVPIQPNTTYTKTYNIEYYEGGTRLNGHDTSISLWDGALVTFSDIPSPPGYSIVSSTPTLPAAMADNSVLAVNIATSSYTVTFDSDGGTAVPSQTVAHNGFVTIPANPIKPGYNFVAWIDYSNSAYDFNDPVTSDLTLTALYIANTALHTVTFNSDGGTAVPSQNVVHNGLVTEPADPVKSGFDFVEWQSGGVAYDFGDPVTSALTLTAIYTRTGGGGGGSGTGGAAIVTQGVQPPSLPFPEVDEGSDGSGSDENDRGDNGEDSPKPSETTPKIRWFALSLSLLFALAVLLGAFRIWMNRKSKDE